MENQMDNLLSLPIKIIAKKITTYKGYKEEYQYVAKWIHPDYGQEWTTHGAIERSDKLARNSFAEMLHHFNPGMKFEIAYGDL
jgi:hypothetical protein